MTDVPTLQLVGGPTALITYGGLRVLTDPTFDPPGDYPRPGTDIVLQSSPVRRSSSTTCCPSTPC